MKADEIGLGDLVWTLATEEEREFAMDPTVSLDANLTAEELLSIRVAYVYDRRIDNVHYLQLLRKDIERYPNVAYLFVRAARAIHGVTMGKPYVALCVLVGIMVILSCVLPTLLGIGIGLVLCILFCLFCLGIETKMLQQFGFTELAPEINCIDDQITRCESILAAARRELPKLEEEGGIPEGAWPFAEQLWEELSLRKAHSLDEAMIHLGFEFAEDE